MLRYPASRRPLLALSAALAACLFAAGCAAGDSYDDSYSSSGDSRGTETARPASVPQGAGIKAGWMDLRSTKQAGSLESLTLVSKSSPEGRKMAAGRATMLGGKVIADKMARDLVDAFREGGFSRYSVKVHPRSAPTGAVGVVWLDDGNGIRSLFLTRGAVQNPATAQLPRTYGDLKKLILAIHQATPGAAVSTGTGWSGDSMFRQDPSKRDR